ncbi:MAG TPA: response regulator [Thermoguttaceae bacterium]|nr:response regulator [Thermoguttaceae bacterium]
MSPSRPHVLVLEDAPTYRQIIVSNLSDAGFRVSAATDVGRALSLAEHERFDLAIVDYYLPDYPGTEFIKRLRATPRYEHLPIIVLTARDEELNLEYLRDKLAVVVLSKNCAMRHVLDAVSERLAIAGCAS